MKLIPLFILAATLTAQTVPLELVEVEGTTRIAKEAVIRFAGLQIGEPTNKEKIEAACHTLEESQLFEQISYKYRPGAKHGYVVTLTVSDLGRLMDASIDIAGVDQAAYWEWMKTISPAFDHKVSGPAQDFLARQLEQHAVAALSGQHVVARLETDVSIGRNLIAFQPENLPSVASVSFEGPKEFTSAELTALMKNAMADGFTDRTFNKYVDLNLRPAYENHGMYRVRFAPVVSHAEGQTSVSVRVPIDEGGKYTLGDVELVGDNLPQEAMFKSAKLPKGQVANWMVIQTGIDRMETTLKRVGYFEAAAKPERKLDDGAHALNLRIPFHTGPVYHYSDTVYKGLGSEMEAKAKAVWKRAPGDTWDVMYVSEFLSAFRQEPAIRTWKVSLEERASKDSRTITEVLTFKAP